MLTDFSFRPRLIRALTRCRLRPPYRSGPSSAFSKPERASKQAPQPEEDFSVAVVAISSADQERTKKCLCYHADGQVVRQARLADHAIRPADFIGTEKVGANSEQRIRSLDLADVPRTEEEILVGQQFVRRVSAEPQRATQAEDRQPFVVFAEGTSSRSNEEYGIHVAEFREVQVLKLG